MTKCLVSNFIELASMSNPVHLKGTTIYFTYTGILLG